MWIKGIGSKEAVGKQVSHEWMKDHDAKLSWIGLAASVATCALGGHIGYRGKRRGWLYLAGGVALSVLHGLRLGKLRRDYRARAQRRLSCPLCRWITVRRG